jgi:hypothetical protein
MNSKLSPREKRRPGSGFAIDDHDLWEMVGARHTGSLFMRITRHKRLTLNWRRLRGVGALLALAGFLSQYPLPVLHRCPVMNPGSVASHTEQSETGPADHVSPCHRHPGATGQNTPAAARNSTDGPHDHAACPVCQGHAQLVSCMPAADRPSLCVLFQFQLLNPPQLAAPRVTRVTGLPPARAPPILS